MARKNTVKRYFPETWYHIYNRGVNRSPIFFDNQDYWAFRRAIRHGMRHVKDRIRIGAFALLENHFHLLIFQTENTDISKFMRSAMGNYSAYIQARYHRTGHLYESIFKARPVGSDEAFEVVKQYILNNPIEAGYVAWKHVGTDV